MGDFWGDLRNGGVFDSVKGCIIGRLHFWLKYDGKNEPKVHRNSHKLTKNEQFLTPIFGAFLGELFESKNASF